MFSHPPVTARPITAFSGLHRILIPNDYHTFSFPEHYHTRHIVNCDRNQKHEKEFQDNKNYEWNNDDDYQGRI